MAYKPTVDEVLERAHQVHQEMNRRYNDLVELLLKLKEENKQLKERLGEE